MIFKGSFQLKPMGLLFFDTGWEADSTGLSYSGKNVSAVRTKLVPMSLSSGHACFQNHDQETKGRIKPSRRRVFVGKEKPPSFLVKAGALQTGFGFC